VTPGDPMVRADQVGLIVRLYEPETLDHQLDLAREVGARAIELTQAGRSETVDRLVGDPGARAVLQEKLERRGLRLAALNCSGMPLHPTRGAQHRRLIRQTILLAEQLGVTTIVCMSGTPGDGPAASTITWVCYPWPDDLVERQWDEAVPVWRELAGFAREHGVDRIGLELHPLHLVYNVPTLERMRSAVGPLVGATVDPSHLFWQQMDPVAVVEALGPAVHHVQLKDTEIQAEHVALTGLLDQRPFGANTERAFIHRTIGRAHGRAFWRAFLGALAAGGYAGSLSIENEDPRQPYDEGVREAAAFVHEIIDATERARAS
jgi:sugar phosphate isomerase/epimerase